MSDLSADQILKPIEVKASKELQLNDGEFKIQSVTDFTNQAKFMMASGLVPKSFKSAIEVAGALFLAKTLNLAPTSISEMYYIGGKLTVYGSTLMAVVQKSPRYQEWIEYSYDETGKKICPDNGNIKTPVYGVAVKVRNKGCTEFTEFYFNLDQAKEAGLFKNAVWKQYTSDMLFWKARSRAMKSLFASELHGAQIKEEVEMEQISNQRDVVDLNEV